jgi:hypothetical protein
MTSKELRKVVEDKIYEGKSYATVFEELLSHFPNRERDLARVIADVPSLTQRRKYLWMNIVLIVCISLNVLLKLLDALASTEEFGMLGIIFGLVFPALYVYFLFMIAFWKPKYYEPAAALAAVSIVWNTIVILTSGALPALAYVFLGIYFLMLLAIAILGSFLGRNIGGKYKVGTQTYKDASGQVRKRQVVKWLN